MKACKKTHQYLTEQYISVTEVFAYKEWSKNHI